MGPAAQRLQCRRGVPGPRGCSRGVSASATRGLDLGHIAAGQPPVELRLPKGSKIISGTAAGPDDFDTEFLDYILAVKVGAKAWMRP